MADSWWDGVNKKAVAISAVAAAIVAIIGIPVAWDKYKSQTHDCIIEGTVYDATTQLPKPKVKVGYVDSSRSFNQLAQTGPLGTFHGECNEVADNLSTSSFELWELGGDFHGQRGLPCLVPRDARQRVRNRGTHTGLVLQIEDC